MGKQVKAPKIMSSGVGESRIHASGAGRDPKWDTATINGMPIPVAMIDQLPWIYTDQGAAEANAGKGQVHARNIVDKVQREADDEDLVLNQHPLEALSEGVEPGFHKRFLSPIANDRAGGVSARRYEVVKDEKGDPIKYGSLVLAKMPKKRAENIRKSRLDESERTIQRGMERAQQEQERFTRDTQGGISSLRPNETIRRDDGMSGAVSMGLRSSLGAEPTAVRPPE